ncbi:MAG: nucleotidyl transferase AbiEii/AbiGii toxin family protein [candidate division NC10 bacterium]|nr:nucleotidyl transferase AbiEii/AbiGii toxin family protein [candidate division NC10 bacterium]
MIPQRNLSLLSNRLARAGGRRIPEAVLERDYCLSWFLVGLSGSPLRERLLFKGGTALKKCHFPDYRFSEDLDFTLAQPVPFETIRRELEETFKVAHRASGVVLRYAREDRHQHANTYTFYLGYEGPLPGGPAGKEVKVDITIKEEVVFPIEERPLLRGYQEYEDLPEDARVQVYSLPEIAAEKVVALLDRARNEPRDLYDLWHLTEDSHVSLDQVVEAVRRKLAARGQELKSLRGVLREKEPRYRRLWETRLSAQVAVLPDFDQVFRAVRRALRQVGLA